MTAGWTLQIDRVVVTGVTARMPDSGELQTLIHSAVADAASRAAPPARRAVHAAVRVRAPALGSGQAIAQAVAKGVSQALKGCPHG